MSKISPCLWFDGEAEEAAKFYVSLLPDSRIETIQKNTVDSPAGKAGSVLVVEFTLAGQQFLALNGGTRFEYTHAVSFKIDCKDQAEVDRLWDTLSANGGFVHAFGTQSGIVATVTGQGNVVPTIGNQSWFEYGGRLGYRISKGWVADLFVNGTAGPQPVGNTIHGGIGLRVSY